MKITNTICDLCGKVEKAAKDRHWTESFGKALFDLKDIAGLQWKLEKELCKPCGERIQKSIFNTMEEIRKEINE